MKIATPFLPSCCSQAAKRLALNKSRSWKRPSRTFKTPSVLATCRLVVQAHIGRIEAYDRESGLGAITVVNPGALERADAIDRALASGEELGPLF